MKIIIKVSEPIKKVQEFQEYDLGQITTTLQDLLDNSSIIVDSNIIPVLKVLTIDNVVKLYLIKDLNESIYNTTDYITGQDLIEEHLLLITGDNQNSGSTVNTAFANKTYLATMSVPFDSANPNIEIDLTGNLDLTITGTSNGDSGLVNLYFSGTEVATINGTKSLSLTGTGVMIPIYFIHDSDGIKWYDGRESTGNQDLLGLAPIDSPAFTGTPTATTATVGTNTTQLATTAFVLANAGASVDTSDFALSEGTILHYPVATTTAGTFSNVGDACTGIGTAITSQMIGAKVTKANGEVGIIATVSNSTLFTATGFTTNSTNTAFSVKVIAVKVGNDGFVRFNRQDTGEQTMHIEPNGNVQIGGNNFQPNGNVTINGFLLGVQGQVELLGTGAVNAKMLTFRQLHTTSSLPSLASNERGTAWVTDALSPTYRGILVGGGTVGCMVTWDGTNWRT